LHVAYLIVAIWHSGKYFVYCLSQILLRQLVPTMQDKDFQFPLFSRKVWAISGLLFLALVTVFVGFRTYKNFSPAGKEFNWDERGHSDFHNMSGYAKAFGDGVSPYAAEVMDNYVVTRPAAPFSPLEFLLHLPFTYFELPTSDVVFFAVHFSLFGLLAFFCVRMSRVRFDWVLWVWVLGLLVVSRPGHISLFTGYFTVQLVLGTLLAIHYSKSRPWLAALGFMLASGKPTYFIPLTILLAFRRDFKTLVFGLVLTGAIAFGGLAFLASTSSFGEVIEGIKTGQQAFDDDPTEFPINTWTRIDVLGMVAKALNWIPGNAVYLGAMLLMILLPGWAVYKARQHESNGADVGAISDLGASGLSAIILVLALLVTLYHHSYDCLLCCVACSGLVLAGERVCPTIPHRLRQVMAFLLAVPAVNYLSTQSVRDKLELDQYGFVWQSITMINGVCLLLALLIAMTVAFRLKPDVGRLQVESLD
jgi:hypothetical protein